MLLPLFFFLPFFRPLFWGGVSLSLSLSRFLQIVLSFLVLSLCSYKCKIQFRPCSIELGGAERRIPQIVENLCFLCNSRLSFGLISRFGCLHFLFSSYSWTSSDPAHLLSVSSVAKKSISEFVLSNKNSFNVHIHTLVLFFEEEFRIFFVLDRREQISSLVFRQSFSCKKTTPRRHPKSCHHPSCNRGPSSHQFWKIITWVLLMWITRPTRAISSYSRSNYALQQQHHQLQSSCRDAAAASPAARRRDQRRRWSPSVRYVCWGSCETDT